jgi:hypothetical protein
MLINGVCTSCFFLRYAFIYFCFFIFLGRVNSLYRVRDEKISQIVKSDPQWPQSFYPLPSEVDIKAGDAMVGQCVYDNDEDRAISVG